MTRLSKKSTAWKKLKEFYNKFDTDKIRYQTATVDDILAETAKLSKLTNLRLKKPEKKYKSFNKAYFWSFLNENQKKSLVYRKAKKDDIIQIINDTKKKAIVKEIRVNNIKKFLANPVSNKSLNIKANELLDAIEFTKITNDYFLRLEVVVDNKKQYAILNDVSSIIDLLNKVNDGIDLYEVNTDGSDEELLYNAVKYDENINLKWFKINPQEGVKKKNSGAYFKWFNATILDLKHYQIFTKDDESKEYDDENCLIYALMKSGVNKIDLDNLKLDIINKEIPASDLTKIAKRLNISIELRILDSDKVRRINTDSNGVKVSLGLVDNHYFINNKTNITLRAIEEYETFKDHIDFPSIKNKKRIIQSYLTSFQLISLLYKKYQDTLIIPIDLNTIRNRETVDKLVEYKNIREINKDCHCNKKCEDMDFCKTIEYRDYSRSGDKKPFKGFYPLKEYDPNFNYNIIFVDCETFISSETNYHIPFCVEATYYYNNRIGEDIENDVLSISKNDKFYKKSFYGLDSAKDFINSIKNNSIIIAHNMGFDFRCFIDYIYDLSNCIETGTRLKSLQAKIYKGDYTCKKTNKIKKSFKHVLFKDSMAFLPSKLADLPEQFKLECGDKDVYPYTLINGDNFDKLILLSDVRKHINFGDRKAFTKNCIKSSTLIEINSHKFVDIKKYTQYYCKQDVNILSQAYTCFRKQVLKITKIDIINLISLPQLSDEYFKNEGVYDGCYSISGIAQDFIRRCCVGGRVMISENKKAGYNSKNHIYNVDVKIMRDYTLINDIKIEHHKSFYTKEERELIEKAIKCGKISDFDAVSLYPSAMSRMDGYPKGLPKVIPDEDIKNFETAKLKYDSYYIQIIIKDIKIKRAFPLLSIKNKNGIRNFTNDIIGETFYVDKISLEDIVEFQGVEYQVIQGYYYNEGLNTKIKETIEFMFQERLKLKKEGNPLQNTYKLMLNSSYGKLLQKAIKHNKEFISDDKVENYVVRNYKFINAYTKINDDLYCVKLNKSTIQHFTCVHIASLILSMSKRIMNEVMCLAEDNSIKIMYQDTDSMHLFNKDLSNLEEIYEKKYKRVLTGDNMGQFNSDFEVHDEFGKKIKTAKNIVAVESIFLGKKCYIDKLRYTNEFGNTKYDYHIRIKGVPTQSIKDFDKNIMKTYKRLYDGEELKFDLEKYCPLQLDADYKARKKTTGLSRSLKF